MFLMHVSRLLKNRAENGKTDAMRHTTAVRALMLPDIPQGGIKKRVRLDKYCSLCIRWIVEDLAIFPSHQEY